MDKNTVVALDAMGGDHAPQEIIKGAIAAIKERDDVKVKLVGKREVIEKELAQYEYPADRCEIVDASEEISNNEAPVLAIRTKKDSSIVVGLNLVHHGEADAFVSAGCTGAVLVGGQLIVGRIKGVERPPLAPLIPTQQGVSLLIDCGANVDARPSHLVQFARMGSVYMQYAGKVSKPRVAIVNIGAEAEKGNALVKETYPLLEACEDIHFIGNIEARDIPKGMADVIVCEAFVGNVILKMYEGVGSVMLHTMKDSFMSTFRSKIGALLLKPALKKSLTAFDMKQYGGAPMLGLKGLVCKTHGSSDWIEVKNTIFQCVTFTEQKISDRIKENLFSESEEQQ